MEFRETVRRRAMVRSFSPEPVDRDLIDRLLDDALRSPTAGNVGGTAWVALHGRDQTAAYWSATTDGEWRGRNRERAEGLLRAPIVLLAYTSRATYVARYAEPDKADSGLGAGPEAWPLPYWYGDAAFGVMAVLLGAVDAGLGACLLGAFRGEDRLAAALDIPAGWQLFGAVVVGWPDGQDRRSSSLDRFAPSRSSRIHRGRW